MNRFNFKNISNVMIDFCRDCGFWLDAGELSQIRSLYDTEEERRQAAHEYFAEVFGDRLASMEADDEAKLERVRRIAGMFRLLCPSYYIPGEQDWGAF